MPNAQFRSSSTTSTRTLSSWSVRMKNIKAQIINTCIAKNNSHSFLHNLKHNQTALWGRRTTRHRGRLSLSCCNIFTRARTTAMSSMAGNCHHHTIFLVIVIMTIIMIIMSMVQNNCNFFFCQGGRAWEDEGVHHGAEPKGEFETCMEACILYKEEGVYPKG